jgi:Rps23 Pro-64 3,4-dihydroxylase Tpa1-like proline 4-hydroxylase
MSIINEKIYDRDTVQKLKAAYNAGIPYKHVAIDNFLKQDVADTLCDKFPKLSEMKVHYKGLNENKAEDSNFAQYDAAFQEYQSEIRSEKFLTFLSELTGIKNLSSPNDALGSGTHQGQNGSYLDIHVDFNIHPTEDLHRRINVLLFLNRDWKAEYGGKLEMWDAKMTQCITTHLPLLNRMVIFETNEISYHGYGTITVPEGITRKSIYGYYYTKASETANDLQYHDTVFRPRPSDGTAKKVQTTVKETLKNSVKRQMKNFGVIKFYYDTLFAIKNRQREK